MKYAIVSLGGKQHKIEEGSLIEVPGGTVIQPDILLYSDGKKTELGKPVLSDVTLDFEVIEEKNGKKVQVKRFKAKSRYKKNKGHKQSILVLKVTRLGSKGNEKEEPASADKVEKTEKSVKKVKSSK